MKTAADLVCEVPLLSSDDRATRARSVLRDDHFREALVVDGRGALAGYIDISDVLRIGATRSNVTVDGFVREAPSVPAGASLERVGALMREYRTDSVAVVGEDGCVLGGILLADVFPILLSRHEPRGIVSELMSAQGRDGRGRGPGLAGPGPGAGERLLGLSGPEAAAARGHGLAAGPARLGPGPRAGGREARGRGLHGHARDRDRAGRGRPATRPR